MIHGRTKIRSSPPRGQPRENDQRRKLQTRRKRKFPKQEHPSLSYLIHRICMFFFSPPTYCYYSLSNLLLLLCYSEKGKKKKSTPVRLVVEKKKHPLAPIGKLNPPATKDKENHGN